MNFHKFGLLLLSALFSVLSFCWSLLWYAIITVLTVLSIPIWLMQAVFSPGSFRFSQVSRLAECEDYLHWLYLRLGSDSNGDNQRVRFFGVEFILRDGNVIT